MSLHITRWKPDTCENEKCQILYQWDDAQPEDIRSHSVVEIQNACPAHRNIVDKEAHYTIVKEENSRKNRFEQFIRENTALGQDKVQDDGSVIKEIKPSAKYTWRFDENRVLQVSLTGLKATEKIILDGLALQLFGAGKVVVK